jgi:ribosomal peptide maturation radical SAM protein 1
MPFGHAFAPSLALSLLKAELAAAGLPAEVHYFSIRFAERMGEHAYHGIAGANRPPIEDLAGEWIFSRALFGARPADDAYVEEVLRRRATGGHGERTERAPAAVVAAVRRARAQAEEFLDGCLRLLLSGAPRIVGFTSMFQQHVASLALARRVKEARPDTFVVFGGANCVDAMGAETVRQFPFVDAAVSGEADLVFPELAKRVLEGRSLAGMAGVRTREGVSAEFASGRFSTAPMVPDLDALPFPDYTDFFAQFAASRFGRGWLPRIFFETSRGCWWGEKMHCTFCGLNGQTMAFRRKSPARALAELAQVTGRYPGCAVEMTDNILDMGYFKEFLPALAARPLATGMFYEVKSNLRKDQLRLLRDAGVGTIQPGIESLSDAVLALMRKGVTGLQNVQLLKWCKELGLQPGWNVLWGFPGEPPEEYERMADLVPLLAHLPPPEAFGTIRLDRFSPNFADAERMGFTAVSPLPSYAYAYALDAEARRNLAYFFTFAYREPRDVGAYVARLHRALHRWQTAGSSHDLFSVDTGDSLLVWDLRPRAAALLTVLRGADRLLYQACDATCDLRRLGEAVRRAGQALAEPEVERRLDAIVAAGLAVRQGSRFLALAIPVGEYSPPPAAVDRLYELVRARGTRVAEGWRLSAEAGRRPVPGRSRSRRPRAGAAAARRRRRLTAREFAVDDNGDVLIRRPRRPVLKGGVDACEAQDR